MPSNRLAPAGYRWIFVKHFKHWRFREVIGFADDRGAKTLLLLCFLVIEVLAVEITVLSLDGMRSLLLW